MDAIALNPAFAEISTDELYSVVGGFDLVTFVGGVTVVTGVLGAVCPPLYAVTLVGGAFLIGYGIGKC